MRTFLTEAWHLRVPIIGAPMSPMAGGRLAAALSKSGALGMIGVGSAQPVQRLLDDVRDFQSQASGHAFGIGLMTWAIAARPELLDAAIASKPFAIALSFGDPAPFAARIRAAGIELVSQVQDRASALAAQLAGATLLVAQGTEAGGHTGGVGTLPLLQIVLDVATVPVVAAGGIATGRGLAAVLAAGAEGAWLGTPFLVAEEARNDSNARERLISANETATVLTSVFDVAQGIPWPAKFRGRALKNAFTEQWSGREAELATDGAARADLVGAVRAADSSLAPIYAGQTVGLLNRVEPAADILRRIEEDAELQLRAVLRVVGA
ncbi:MAG TPA: nitronate monooxygenase [Polyangiaceae bacterium]|nr:nitronate monooxygenase [Polyangiaceae bacterium]